MGLKQRSKALLCQFQETDLACCCSRDRQVHSTLCPNQLQVWLWRWCHKNYIPAYNYTLRRLWRTVGVIWISMPGTNFNFLFRCFMALTRGSKALYPCPVCLVPHEELSNLFQSFPLRTTSCMWEIWEEGQRLNLGEREAHLRQYGLCDVQVLLAHFFLMYLS